ncbi:MAG: hypothetical protein ACJAY8_000994 [Sphingobacteriales bacterium]|jgi:hypothetical protein
MPRIICLFFVFAPIFASAQYTIQMYDGKLIETSRIVEGKNGVSFEHLVGEKKLRGSFSVEGIFEVAKEGEVIKNFYEVENPERDMGRVQMRNYVYGRRDAILSGYPKSGIVIGIAAGLLTGFAYPSTFMVGIAPLMGVGVMSLWPVKVTAENESPYYKLGYRKAKRKQRKNKVLITTLIGTFTGVVLGNVIKL